MLRVLDELDSPLSRVGQLGELDRLREDARCRCIFGLGIVVRGSRSVALLVRIAGHRQGFAQGQRCYSLAVHIAADIHQVAIGLLTLDQVAQTAGNGLPVFTLPMRVPGAEQSQQNQTGGAVLRARTAFGRAKAAGASMIARAVLEAPRSVAALMPDQPLERQIDRVFAVHRGAVGQRLAAALRPSGQFPAADARHDETTLCAAAQNRIAGRSHPRRQQIQQLDIEHLIGQIHRRVVPRLRFGQRLLDHVVQQRRDVNRQLDQVLGHLLNGLNHLDRNRSVAQKRRCQRVDGQTDQQAQMDHQTGQSAGQRGEHQEPGLPLTDLLPGLVGQRVRRRQGRRQHVRRRHRHQLRGRHRRRHEHGRRHARRIRRRTFRGVGGT